jgi:hypothetical protein
VTRNDPGSFLDFDKRADFSIVADLATIEIRKVEDFYIQPELDVRRYSL